MQSSMQLNQWSKHHINLLKSSLNSNFKHMDPKKQTQIQVSKKVSKIYLLTDTGVEQVSRIWPSHTKQV